MAAFVQALSLLSTNREVDTKKAVAIFRGAGLVVPLVCMIYGLDLSPGFF